LKQPTEMETTCNVFNNIYKITQMYRVKYNLILDLITHLGFLYPRHSTVNSVIVWNVKVSADAPGIQPNMYQAGSKKKPVFGAVPGLASVESHMLCLASAAKEYLNIL